jgi:hypothetical protein
MECDCGDERVSKTACLQSPAGSPLAEESIFPIFEEYPGSSSCSSFQEELISEQPRSSKRSSHSPPEESEDSAKPEKFRPCESLGGTLDMDSNAAFERGLESQIMELLHRISDGTSECSHLCSSCHRIPGCIQCFLSMEKDQKCLACHQGMTPRECDNGECSDIGCDGVQTTTLHHRGEVAKFPFVLPGTKLCEDYEERHCSTCHASLCDDCFKLNVDFLVDHIKNLPGFVRRNSSYRHWLGPTHLKKLSELFGSTKFEAEWEDEECNEIHRKNHQLSPLSPPHSPVY